MGEKPYSSFFDSLFGHLQASFFYEQKLTAVLPASSTGGQMHG